MSRSLASRSSSFGVAAQHVEIAIHVVGLDRRHRHAPLDPALQRALLVKREIMGGLRAQKIDDLGQPIRRRVLRRRAVIGARVTAIRRPYLTSASGILATGSTRSTAPVVIALRGMPSIAGLVGVLRDDEAALFLDGFQPEAAVGAGSRKDHADGARAVVLRQRVQQEVERQARAVARLGLREVQGAVADGEIGAGRNDIEVVALERHSVGGLPHGHRRVAGQQVHHHAFVGRIEMLDQDEGHAVAGRQRVQQLPAGVEAARRGADPDDDEISDAARRRGAPAQSRSGCFGRRQTACSHTSTIPEGPRA